MNKTTEKILMSPINLFAWISHNTAETCMMGVFLCSILPFFMEVKSPTFAGGVCAFVSMVMLYIIARVENKQASKLQNILMLTIMILGMVSFFMLSDKKTDDTYSEFEKCLCVYGGAFGGLLIGTVLFGMIEKHREDRKAEREMDNRRAIIRTSVPATCKSDKVAIRNSEGDKIIGYIDKEEYNDFINKHTTISSEQGKENKA
jgi:hypothetical protein